VSLSRDHHGVPCAGGRLDPPPEIRPAVPAIPEQRRPLLDDGAVPAQFPIGAQPQELERLPRGRCLQDPVEQRPRVPARGGVAGRDRDLQLGESPVKRHLPRRERLAQVRERLEREQPHGAPPRDESPRPLAVEGHPRLPVEPPRPVQRPDHDRRTGRRPEEAGRVEAVERPGYPPQQREVGRDRTREDDDVGDAPVVWGGDATDRSLKLQQRSAAGVFALALTPVVVALLTSSR
jgi:hypothetical protein